MKHNREYFNIHRWLAKNHGKATKCENEKCTSKNPKRFEWALLKGKQYRRDRNNYIELCPSCHRKYDMTDALKKKLSKANIGKPNFEKRKMVIFNDKTIFDSLTIASEKTGVSITSISNNILGLTKSTRAGVFKIYK